MEKVFVNLDRYGNTCNVSIPLVLNEAIKNGKIKENANVVLVGFGSGLTWGAIEIKWVTWFS